MMIDDAPWHKFVGQYHERWPWRIECIDLYDDHEYNNNNIILCLLAAAKFCENM